MRLRLTVCTLRSTHPRIGAETWTLRDLVGTVDDGRGFRKRRRCKIGEQPLKRSRFLLCRYDHRGFRQENDGIKRPVRAERHLLVHFHGPECLPLVWQPGCSKQAARAVSVDQSESGVRFACLYFLFSSLPDWIASP